MAVPLRMVWWFAAGRVTFRSYFGRSIRCSSSGAWQGCSQAQRYRSINCPHCARLVQLPTWPPGLCSVDLLWQPPLFFEQVLYFSLHLQIQGSETTDVFCFLLKKHFFPWGLIVAWIVSWQKEPWVWGYVPCVVGPRHIMSAFVIDNSCFLVTELYVLKSLFWKLLPCWEWD